eukprot:4552218-Ditylum_brightwellii.AAC.1
MLCRSVFGVLKEQSEKSLTIYIEPWEYAMKYSLSYTARIARWKPSLDEYQHEEQPDTTPKEWIATISKSHHNHKYTLPNRLDFAISHYPQFLAQKGYEAMDLTV